MNNQIKHNSILLIILNILRKKRNIYFWYEFDHTLILKNNVLDINESIITKYNINHIINSSCIRHQHKYKVILFGQNWYKKTKKTKQNKKNKETKTNKQTKNFFLGHSQTWLHFFKQLYT